MNNHHSVKIITLRFLSVILIFAVLFFFSQLTKLNTLSIEQEHFLATKYDDEIRKLSLTSVINNDFKDDEVIVILNHQHSKINGKVSLSDFQPVSNNIAFESIKDEFRITNPEKRTKNSENFRQILSLKLIEKSKENVLRAIDELEQLDNVLIAMPSYIYGVSEDWQPNDVYYSKQWGLTELILVK